LTEVFPRPLSFPNLGNTRELLTLTAGTARSRVLAALACMAEGSYDTATSFHLTHAVGAEITALAGRCGREVVPCFWQRGGPQELARDSERLSNRAFLDPQDCIEEIMG
jgi:hypothetical protein